VQAWLNMSDLACRREVVNVLRELVKQQLHFDRILRCVETELPKFTAFDHRLLIEILAAIPEGIILSRIDLLVASKALPKICATIVSVHPDDHFYEATVRLIADAIRQAFRQIVPGMADLPDIFAALRAAAGEFRLTETAKAAAVGALECLVEAGSFPLKFPRPLIAPVVPAFGSYCRALLGYLERQGSWPFELIEPLRLEVLGVFRSRLDTTGAVSQILARLFAAWPMEWRNGFAWANEVLIALLEGGTVTEDGVNFGEALARAGCSPEWRVRLEQYWTGETSELAARVKAIVEGSL
jgi:hypothetical protein